ncbi:MAG: ATP-binding cassette domain-containing protein, partial [Atribacterota bacterium]|nr:ATP-binding cassette domain-containing protein [Atribacterota bacterium]
MVPDNSNNILEIKNITVSYGPIIALKKVFLEVKQGQVVILIGSNGAGKSTLLNTIIGLEKPDEGRIIYHTDDITFWLPERVTRS